MGAKIGHKVSEETRKKLSLQKLGDKNPAKRSEVKEKIRIARSKQVVTAKMLEALDRNRKARWNGHIPMMKDKVYASWSKNQWHHRKRNATGSHTYEEWETLKAQYNWTCPCCKLREPFNQKTKFLTVDHIIPLSKGGSNNIENIQPLCRSCNCKKNAKTIKY